MDVTRDPCVDHRRDVQEGATNSTEDASRAKPLLDSRDQSGNLAMDGDTKRVVVEEEVEDDVDEQVLRLWNALQAVQGERDRMRTNLERKMRSRNNNEKKGKEKMERNGDASSRKNKKKNKDKKKTNGHRCRSLSAPACSGSGDTTEECSSDEEDADEKEGEDEVVEDVEDSTRRDDMEDSDEYSSGSEDDADGDNQDLKRDPVADNKAVGFVTASTKRDLCAMREWSTKGRSAQRNAGQVRLIPLPRPPCPTASDSASTSGESRGEPSPARGSWQRRLEGDVDERSAGGGGGDRRTARANHTVGDRDEGTSRPKPRPSNRGYGLGLVGVLSLRERSGAMNRIRASTILASSMGILSTREDTTSHIFNLEWHPSGSTLVAVGEDGTIRMFDPHCPKIVNRIVNAHFNCVNVAKFISDVHLVTGSDDSTLRLFDIRKGGRCLNILNGHTSWVKNVEVFSSRQIITTAFDGTVRLWDVDRSDPAPAPGSSFNASGSNNGEIIFQSAGIARIAFSPAAGNCVGSIPSDFGIADLLPDARLIISFTSGNIVIFNDFDISDATRRREVFETDVSSLCEQVEEGIPVSALPPAFVRPRNRVEVLSEAPYLGYTTSLQASRCGNYLLTRRHLTRDGSEISCLFSLAPSPPPVPSRKRNAKFHFPSRLLHLVPDSSAGMGFIKEPCFSPRPPYFVCSPYYRGVRMFLVEQSAKPSEREALPTSCVPVLNAHDAPVLTCRYHPFLPMLASGGLDGKVVLYAAGQT